MIPEAFRNLLCQAFTGSVDSISLHTDDPGTTGANDSAVPHEALAWTSPDDGSASATVLYEDLTGEFTHVGLWDGATFRMGIKCPIKLTAPADVVIMVTHTDGVTTV